MAFTVECLADSLAYIVSVNYDAVSFCPVDMKTFHFKKLLFKVAILAQGYVLVLA